MLRRMTWTVLLLGLCLPLSAQPATPQAGSVLLFDFERPEDLKTWQVRTETALALNTAWASHGQASAAVTFMKYAPGKEEWPAIVATRQTGWLPTESAATFDFLTKYGTFRFDAYNPQAVPASVNLQLRDTAGHRFSATFALAPHVLTACATPLQTIGQSIELKKLSEIHFYLTRPAQTSTVYLDNVSLSPDLETPAKALLKRAETNATQVTALLADGADRLPVDLRRQARHSATLKHQLQELVSRLSTAPPTTEEELLSTRGRLQRLETELDQSDALLWRLKAAVAMKGKDVDFLLAAETSMRKVFLESRRLESPYTDHFELAAARNEAESFQTILVPVKDDLTSVTWSMSPLRSDKGKQIAATVRLVGYVNCKQPSYKVTSLGWWPDPLLDFMDKVDVVPVGEVLPLWVTVKVPEDAAAGTYEGKLTVKAQGVRSQTMTVKLRVYDFAIPKTSSLRTALSFRDLGPTYKSTNVDVKAITRKYEDWMLREYRLNPGSIYAQAPPDWDVARLRELMAMGLNTINLCYIWAPVGSAFNAVDFWKKFEEQTKAVEAYLPTIDAAGARKLCYIYCFDERPADQLGVLYEAAEKLRKKFPDIPVMTTAYDQTFGLDRANGDAVQIWVPLTPKFDSNAARIAEAQSKGRDIWWYICIGPQHPWANWFVEYPAIEGRLLMGAMTAKYRPGGFLYYAVNRWLVNDRPITSGPRTDWNPASYLINNGDGSIMCAGPTGPLATVRLENIRDGLEDYEYYLLLRKLLKEKGKPASIGEVPAEVVTNLTTFTEDPAVLTAERSRVAAQIEALRR
ncbi:DUF4091 domain-containing protein [bacterium]|nr:DUF4091 domain-containing protein [bacterium]